MVKKLYRYRSSKRESLIVQINEGWGEIAPLPGFSKETLEEAKKEILDYFNTGTSPRLPSVRFGLFSASKPYDSNPFSIPLCAFKTPFAGSTHLKLKLGDLSLANAISLTQKYAGKYLLRIDCNRSWTLEKTLAFARNFSLEHFDYFEEPIDSFEDLVEFSKQTKIPIAIDESFRDALPYENIPSLKAIVVKPTLIGCIPPIPSHLSCVLSSSFESSLGLLQIARLAPPHIPHGLHTFSDDLLIPPLFADKGQLRAHQHTINQDKLCLIASHL